MSMAYIRTHYRVPAKRGGRVEFTSSDRDGREVMEGTITGSRGASLRVRLDGNNRSYIFHPTYNLRYLEPQP